MRGRRVARAALATAIVGAALGLTAATAAADDPATPPGWIGPGDVRFTLGSTTLSQGDEVDLNRDYVGADVFPAFGNWSDPEPGDLTNTRGWPVSFSASGVTLERVSFCPYTAATCRYRLMSGDDANFWVAAGPPDNPDGSPAYNKGSPQPIDVQQPPPPPPPNPGQVVGKVIYTPGSGTAVFDATGSVAPDGMTLTTYRWRVTGGSFDETFTCEAINGPTCPLPSHLTLPAGTYNVQLELLGPLGELLLPSPALAPFTIDPPAQAPTDPGPTPPSGGGGGLPAGGGGGFPGVFARPVSRAPASLTGGTGDAFPTVVWLWRPEWFQGSANALPQTAGEPEVKGKTAVVIADSPAPADTNAAPWLAGLGAFGLIGAGFVINRWFRWRAAHL